MSKKQLGAAPEAQPEPQPEAQPARGWLVRLRTQPGIRTAAVAFVLTVVLGLGGTAAYAYWSQTRTGTITGTTVRPALPVMTGAVGCQHRIFDVVRITYPRVPTALPADATVLATVVGPGSKTRFYAVPNTGSFVLKDLPGLTDSLSWGDRLTISVTTAYLTGAPGNLPASVDESMVLNKATEAPAETEALFRASYFC